MTRGLPQKGNVLFTTEAPIGNAAVIELRSSFALAQRVICLRPYGDVQSRFLALQLLSDPFSSISSAAATGLTAKGIKSSKLKRLPIAVPPRSEQHRIVAKVDELMALCDRLEAAQAERERRRSLYTRAAHRRLREHGRAKSAEIVADLRPKALTEDVPWQTPRGWTWSSLALIGESYGGGTFSRRSMDSSQ